MPISRETIFGVSIGIAMGSAQTVLLQQYVDIPMAQAYLTAGAKASNAPKPFLLGQLKQFGSPSATIGIVTGVVFTAFGAYSSMKPRYIRSDLVNSALLAYGVTALVGGVISGLFPTQAWSNAVAQDPFNPIGYNPRGKNVVIRSGGATIGGTPTGVARAY